MQAVMEAHTGEPGREALEAYERTQDESKLRGLVDRLTSDAAESLRAEDA